jgi:hypothetical protein
VLQLRHQLWPVHALISELEFPLLTAFIRLSAEERNGGCQHSLLVPFFILLSLGNHLKFGLRPPSTRGKRIKVVRVHASSSLTQLQRRQTVNVLSYTPTIYNLHHITIELLPRQYARLTRHLRPTYVRRTRGSVKNRCRLITEKISAARTDSQLLQPTPTDIR